jgi:uncharacterized RDD family membrane protein YckC
MSEYEPIPVPLPGGDRRTFAPQAPAGRGTRLGAAILDGVFVMLLVWVPFIAALAIEIAKDRTQFDEDTPPELAEMIQMVRASGDETVRGLFYACVAAALVLFVVNACLLTVRGQTLGKLIVGIRIVDPNTDANAGFARTVLLRSGVPMFLNSLSAGIFGLIDVLFIFREDRRCLHDLMANTKVVGRQPAIDPAAFE